ncbi:MAG TPA: hypothetical protein VJ862_02045 [Rhodanobacteraceae bacterium]|nr:hypothetical protein [Rhodanobacteraceae bacterium]
MNARKPIAFFAAMLITAAGMAGIATYSNAAADAARQNAPMSASAEATIIPTLPAINVYPTREQLRQLRGDKAGSPATSAADYRMPFYSFASDAVGA